MSDRKPPSIDDAPGLVWRPRKDGWVATWQAKSELIKAGYAPQTARLWAGTEPTELEASHIAMQCRRLQSDMRVFAKEGDFVVDRPTITIRQLIDKYQTDPDSSYHKKRWAVRKNHDITLKRMVAKHGTVPLSEIKGRVLLAWHKEWSDGGVKVAMAHAFIGHLRTILSFGTTMLEDPECERLVGVLHLMRFKAPKPRTERLTAAQAVAVRATARIHCGWGSMAVAQAFQFDLMLRQKDVIGEWVPGSEPGISDVTRGTDKWITGIRWNEIDGNFVLRHTTSKREKELELNLRLAPMVMEELALVAGVSPAKLTRDDLPPSGPLLRNEVTGLPWSTAEFRRKWRIVAELAGVPKAVKNMDSRSGAISEATDAGIDLEHIRHAATHSDIAMTQRYSRGSTDKIAGVMRGRSEHRNKKTTDTTDNKTDT